MAKIQTVTEQVYHNIFRSIADGTYRQGTKLTLKTLQEELGVSSSPIREALTRLQQDGLIDYQPNVGMSVRIYSEKDVQSIFDLMIEFDIIALKLAMKVPARDELVKELEDNLKESALALELNREEMWHEASDNFHSILLNFTGNTFLSDASLKTRMHLTVFSTRYEEAAESRDRIQAEHCGILDSIIKDDCDEAVERMRAHLTHSYEEARRLTIAEL